MNTNINVKGGSRTAICLAVACTFAAGNDGPTAQSLPHLGDSAKTVDSALGATENGNPREGGYYGPTFGTTPLEISVEYMKTQDGAERLSLLDIRGKGTTLPEDLVKEIVTREKESDSRRISVRSLGKDARFVLWGGQTPHTLQFFDSRLLGRRLKATTYLRSYQGKIWVHGTCPFSNPGTYGILREYHQNDVKRIVVASIYLNTCQQSPYSSP